MRQSEFDECEELDEYGYSKMTWISSVPNEATSWTVQGNYYAVSPEVQAFYDGVMATDNAFKGEGDPLTDHIAGKSGVVAFVKEAIEVANRPEPMIAMAEWYRSPAGGNKTKATTNFNRETDDYDRRNWEYFDQTLDCAYPTNAAAYTGGTDGLPAGDLNWFPDATPVGNRVEPARVFELAQNYPNPFNPSTVISFTLPGTAQTSLSVYNTLGQKVRTLVNGMLAGGYHEFHFDASSFSNGVYFYKLESGDCVSIRKMMLIK